MGNKDITKRKRTQERALHENRLIRNSERSEEQGKTALNVHPISTCLGPKGEVENGLPFCKCKESGIIHYCLPFATERKIGNH